VPIGGDDDHDAVPFGGGPGKGPAGEQDFVIGVGVEGDEGGHGLHDGATTQRSAQPLSTLSGGRSIWPSRTMLLDVGQLNHMLFCTMKNCHVLALQGVDHPEVILNLQDAAVKSHVTSGAEAEDIPDLIWAFVRLA
jgi:hypothetical protein